MNRFGLSTEQYDIIVTILKKYTEVNEVWLYGSRAKGNYNSRSNIDLVIKNSNASRHVVGNILLGINNSNFPYLVDLQDISSIKNPNLLEHIEKVGTLFYKKE